MDDFKNEKLKRFVNDKVMFNAVFEFVLASYTKPKSNAQVNELAAAFLSIGLLQEAWKELDRFAQREIEKKDSVPNVGL